MISRGSVLALLAGWLLWTRISSALPTPEESTPAQLQFETSTFLPHGDVCTTDDECRDSDLFCDTDKGRCQCRDTSAVLSPESNCIPIRHLGEACKFDIQCRSGNGHSTAECDNGICACKDGFAILHETNKTSCVTGKEGDGSIKTKKGPKMYMDINMIIIIVVLAVMFLGMCVALHLFSRARFRNHRTIFNDPHPRLMHIKLGKNKKRRTSHSGSLHVPASRQPSVCSQLSVAGGRSRAGSFAGSKAASPESVRSLKAAIDSKLGAPIAKLDEPPSPAGDDTKKDPNWRSANGPDVVKEAAVVQNGPSSPTIIVTNMSSRSSSEGHSPASATRV